VDPDPNKNEITDSDNDPDACFYWTFSKMKNLAIFFSRLNNNLGLRTVWYMLSNFYMYSRSANYSVIYIYSM
jgi:hypothetical protein